MRFTRSDLRFSVYAKGFGVYHLSMNPSILPKSEGQTSDLAFTLFELLIVITMIVILSGAILPAFSNYINNQNVRQAAEQVKSDLRNAQNKALTGGASDDLINGEKPLYWFVKFTVDTNTYRFYTSVLNTSGVCTNPTGNSIDQGLSGQLPGNTKIGSSTCVFFSFADGGNASPSTVYVKSSSSSTCGKVTISESGLISLSYLQGATCP